MGDLSHPCFGESDAVELAAKALFSRCQAGDARWSGLHWEGLMEGTKRLFRREAMWNSPGR